LAPKHSSAVAGAKVPVEFIGQARTLRGRIAAAHAAREAAAERMLAPFRPTERFTPYPRYRLLRVLAAAWRVLPDPGRLFLEADAHGGKLRITEIRAAPSRLILPGWEADEPALSLVLRDVRIEVPAYRETTATLAIVGLHALARRFERGSGRGDVAIMRALAPLGRAYPGAIKGGGEFAIEAAGGGRWIGAVMMQGTAPVLAVRTFVDG
jgi:hypothetical protein